MDVYYIIAAIVLLFLSVINGYLAITNRKIVPKKLTAFSAFVCVFALVVAVFQVQCLLDFIAKVPVQ